MRNEIKQIFENLNCEIVDNQVFYKGKNINFNLSVIDELYSNLLDMEEDNFKLDDKPINLVKQQITDYINEHIFPVYGL